MCDTRNQQRISPQFSFRPKRVKKMPSHFVVLCLVSVLIIFGATQISGGKFGRRHFYPRIIHGEDAALGTYPCYVRITTWRSFQRNGKNYTSQAICGGTLISPVHVLTAAHCLASEPTLIQCDMGIVSNNDTSRMVRGLGEYFSSHPDFNWTNLTYDLGIITLYEPVNITAYVRPCPVLCGYEQSFLGSTMWVTGEGFTNESTQTVATNLQYARMKIISRDTCRQTYGALQPSVFCAQGDNNAATCGGDSGSGGYMMIDYKQTLCGIVSFGPGRSNGCTLGKPDGFTDVAMCTDFISEYMDLDGETINCVYAK